MGIEREDDGMDGGVGGEERERFLGVTNTVRASLQRESWWAGPGAETCGHAPGRVIAVHAEVETP